MDPCCPVTNLLGSCQAHKNLFPVLSAQAEPTQLKSQVLTQQTFRYLFTEHLPCANLECRQSPGEGRPNATPSPLPQKSCCITRLDFQSVIGNLLLLLPCELCLSCFRPWPGRQGPGPALAERCPPLPGWQLTLTFKYLSSQASTRELGLHPKEQQQQITLCSDITAQKAAPLTGIFKTQRVLGVNPAKCVPTATAAALP